MAKSPICPCGTGVTYARCCRPLHRNEREAEDAEALMRSRFSGFAQKETEYLLRTLHPDNEELKLGRESAEAAIRETAQGNRFVKLVILDRAPPDDAGVARVLFHARVFQKGQDLSFVELSEFTHDGVGFRYLRGEALPARSLGPDVDALRFDTFRARLPQ
jgi:SEC-C motif-containing protein